MKDSGIVQEPTAKQEADILHYMEKHGRISQWIATRELHILRLGARIWDLEKKGYHINREMIYHTDENGNRTKWMEYWLARA